IYLGTAFIATFFNVAVVYCAKKRFEGGNPTFGEGLSEAIKRVHLIFMWSMVSAVVGLILNMIESAARESKSDLTRIILSITSSILGAAWGIVSVFVVPAMVFDNVGPFAALKKSAGAIKKTWGESLVRHYGLGLVQAAFMLLGVLVLIPGIFLLGIIWPIGLGLILVSVIYLVVVVLLFSTANTIFNTALYMYAEGKHQKAFPAEIMKNAFETRKN
ncbi:MAG: hypothetical protein HGA85_01990, partial [Nanoarchaeota archaeon]|nr:hypothetical protein [Nanoarchaeota archaeon]